MNTSYSHWGIHDPILAPDRYAKVVVRLKPASPGNGEGPPESPAADQHALVLARLEAAILHFHHELTDLRNQVARQHEANQKERREVLATLRASNHRADDIARAYSSFVQATEGAARSEAEDHTRVVPSPRYYPWWRR